MRRRCASLLLIAFLFGFQRPPAPPKPAPTPIAPPASPLSTNPYAPRPSAPPRSLLVGLNVVWGKNGGLAGVEQGDRTARLAALLKISGATITRVPLLWADIERTPGAYDWREADKLIRFLKGRGLVLVGVVEKTPAWATGADSVVRKLCAQKGVSVENLPPAPKFLPNFDKFVAELLKRYGALAHRWEFGVAPDGAGNVVVQSAHAGLDLRVGDPTPYAHLLMRFAADAKRADPNALVAVGGLTVPRTEFLQALYAAGAKAAFDAVSLSPSSDAGPLPFDWMDACRAVLVRRGDAGKKFWIASWGRRTYPTDPAGIVEGEQARFLRRALTEIRKRSYIETACFSTLNDPRPADNAPTSLLGTGLCDADLNPRPAFSAFRAEATGAPAPPSRVRRVALVAGPSPSADSEIHLDVFADSPLGAIPRTWRGVSVNEPEGAQGPTLSALGASFKARKAIMVRLPPLSTATEADALQSEARFVAGAGGESIALISPRPSETEEGWATRVTAFAKNFSATRWELAASGEEAKERYAVFAKAARAALPNAPIGLFLEGDPANELATAEIAAQSAPCDSVAWRTSGDPTSEARRLIRLRALLARSPAIKSVTLWPGLPALPPARALAVISRLIEYAPAGGANPLGGVLAPLASAFGAGGDASPTGDALTMLNRVVGRRLRTATDDSDVRLLAARSADGGASVLVWREDSGAKEKLVALRLRGLEPNRLGGLRMERCDAGGAPAPGLADDDGLTRAASSDLPLPAPGEALELPLVLPPGAVTLIQVRPHRPPTIRVTADAARYSVVGGEEFALAVTVRNVSKTPQRPELKIFAEPAGIVPAELRRVSVGALAPGKSSAMRFRMTLPTAGRDSLVTINIVSSGDGRACLTFKMAASVAATLVSPRLDLEAPGKTGVARVRLINATNATPTLSLQTLSETKGANSPADDKETFDLPPGDRALIRPVVVPAPSADPGLYPVDIALMSEGRELTTLRLFVGVPVLCRYAEQPPRIDGDLGEWADADPMGMGRADQVRGEKTWKGPADLSALAYAKWDDKFFYFACAVTDDVFFQPFTGDDILRGDSVRFALATDLSAAPDSERFQDAGDHEFVMALADGKDPTLLRVTDFSDGGAVRSLRHSDSFGASLLPVPRSVVAVRRDGTRTFYEAAIPWSELAPAKPTVGAVFGVSVLVADNDGKETGWIAWGDGIGGERRPDLFPPLRLVR